MENLIYSGIKSSNLMKYKLFIVSQAFHANEVKSVYSNAQF